MYHVWFVSQYYTSNEHLAHYRNTRKFQSKTQRNGSHRTSRRIFFLTPLQRRMQKRPLIILQCHNFHVELSENGTQIQLEHDR